METNMTYFKRALIVVLGLCISACYPLSSKFPLGNQKFDPALLGSWASDEGDTKFVFERKGRKKLSLRVHSNENDDEAALRYEIIPSKIDGKTYISVMQIFPKDSIKAFAKAEEISFSEAKKRLRNRDKRMNGYYLGHYVIESIPAGTMLTIKLINADSDVVAEALENGSLKGGQIDVMTEEGTEDDILYITSSKNKMTDLVKSHGDNPEALFDLEVANLIKEE
jgi:hypothetical protein